MRAGSRAQRLRRVISGIAVGAMMLGSTSFVAARPAVAEDNGAIHSYAPSGVGPDVISGAISQSPDVASAKYTVSANGTPVTAVQYTKGGHNADIARFSSTSRTPVITVTLPTVAVDTVSVYPTRYYPASAISVSADRHTITFQMSAVANLNYALVSVNGGVTDISARPYLAIINDPAEDPATKLDTTSAPDGSGVNTATGVLNFQEFAKEYLAKHPNSTAQLAVASQKSSVAGQTVAGSPIPANQQTAAGKIVAAGTSNVHYPDERQMASNDVSYALSAALKAIADNPGTLNTLYFPAGSYVWSGLEITGFDGSKLKGGKLKIYTDEGALLQNRVQANTEAMEPAIGIWGSSNIEIDGRGMFDGNGVANYTNKAGGDLHDAYSSQHQGGVMIVHSHDIAFNDTYVRDVKQWNWETHTAKNVTFNNIKGLTPYAQPWVDGTDFASGQNITANGVFTMGNDDAFASGHYNPSNGFTPSNSDTMRHFQLGTGSADVQGYVNAVAAYEAVSKRVGYNSNEWDNADSADISVSNQLSWSAGAGNGIRLGYQSLGYQLKNYSFDNFNPTGMTVKGIDVMGSSNIYPRIQSISVKNSSIDSAGIATGLDVTGGDGTPQTITAAQQRDEGYAPNPNGSGADYTITKTPIPDVRLDGLGFTTPVANKVSNVGHLVLNNFSNGPSIVAYTNQANLTTSGVSEMAFTYTDPQGASHDVISNALPVFTSPQFSTARIQSGNLLRFTVAATDPDHGDDVVLSATGVPQGASFDPATGVFSWKPSITDVGTNPTVTFAARDKGAQAGAYGPVTTAVKITVDSSESTSESVPVTADTWVGAWSGDQSVNNSSDLTLIVRNTGHGLLGEQYTTGNGDGKISYVQVDLSKLTAGEVPKQATLELTYVGHRSSSVPADTTDRLLVTPVSDTVCTNGATSCPVSAMTWKSMPKFTATQDNTASSESFTLGSTVVPEGGGNHQNDPIDGRRIGVDVTKFVAQALGAGQTSILFAIGDTSSTNELRFVSTRGAATGGLSHASADMAPALVLTVPTPVSIHGPSTQTIREDDSARSEPFTLTGVSPLAISLSGDTADGKIGWDDATNSLTFVSGIPAGDHHVSLTVKDAGGSTASAEFVLTVTAEKVVSIQVTKPPAKAQYEQGGSFDPSGLEVTATLQDGTTRILSPDEYILTAPDLTKAGTATGSVALAADRSITASFQVTVSAMASSQSPSAPASTAPSSPVPGTVSPTAGQPTAAGPSSAGAGSTDRASSATSEPPTSEPSASQTPQARGGLLPDTGASGAAVLAGLLLILAGGVFGLARLRRHRA